MSKNTTKLLLFLLLFLPFYVSAYPTGAGTCDVDKMTDDGHGPTNLKSPTGFALTTNMPSKGSFELTISGPGGGFKGLLVYVVDSKNQRVGEFVNLPSTMQAKTDDPLCGQGSVTITHKSREDKNLPFKLNWNAPQGTSGNLTVRALVVKNYSNWAKLDDVKFDPVTGASSAPLGSAPITGGDQTGETGGFFKKYLLFIIMIIITTILYIVGSVTEALLKRQQVKSRSFAKTVGGFGNANANAK